VGTLNRKYTPVIIIILAAAILVAGLFAYSGQISNSGEVKPLAAVEIRDYQGKQLSSVNDFHENSIKGPQHINISDYRLTVDGLTNRTMVYTYEDVIGNHQSYSKVITLHCVEGWDATILWQGVLVRDILNEAGISPEAKTVIFHAHDGYTTSFPVEYFQNKDILMAYNMNNITMPAERGYPFELVAEDKWGYKWIKWIERIELSSDTNYQGYWEQRGYSNIGNLSEGFFG